MTTTTAAASTASLLNVPTSKIPNPDAPFARIHFPLRRTSFWTHIHPVRSISATIADNPVASSNNLDDDPELDDEAKRAESKIGAKVKVKVPLKVYHVPKVPEYDLNGKVGELKQYVGVYKGKKISANMPYKVVFVAEEVKGRDGKPVTFFAHLKEDEFEFLD